MGNKDYTIKDIARMSGFSVRTVSRVLNNEKYVKDETREKIQQVLEETGFRRNIFAKNLRKKAMNNILVLIEKQESIYPGQWYTNILQHFINRGVKRGYNVFMREYLRDETRDNNGLELLYSRFVDGVIVFNISPQDPKLRAMMEAEVPFVSIGRNDVEDAPCIDTDDRNGAYLATEHLLKLGYRDIKFLVGDAGYLINQDRIDGFKEALTDYGIDPGEGVIIEGVRSFYDTRQLARDFHRQGQMPKAVFVSGDEKAFGLLKVLNDYNYDIPGEIAVMGYDNIPISEFANPSLTTVEQPVGKIVHSALDQLIALIEGEDCQQTTCIPTRLIIRESTGG
ncbi:MAG: LacI family DNA-binding transcriptional regulator [Bacillota bacterium]